MLRYTKTQRTTFVAIVLYQKVIKLKRYIPAAYSDIRNTLVKAAIVQSSLKSKQ